MVEINPGYFEKPVTSTHGSVDLEKLLDEPVGLKAGEHSDVVGDFALSDAEILVREALQKTLDK